MDDRAEEKNQPDKASATCGGWRTRLTSWTDPELLPLLVFLALPLVFANGTQMRFYASMAVYIVVLKWLGWVVFTRGRDDKLTCLLFPAEIILGLGLATAWFYLRNLIGYFIPASYVLVELNALPFVVLGLHVLGLGLGLASSDGKGDRRQQIGSVWLRRAAVYVPYSFMLFVALAFVSNAYFVQGSDSLYNALLGRFYLNEGLFTIAGQPTDSYPSGCGAINATAVALSPLNMVQAINLQHVLLTVTAMFLVTTLIAHRAKRLFWFLHVLSVPFLSMLPLYSLYPFFGYQGVGRQAAPALFAAICLIPLFGSPVTSWQRGVTLAVQAALCVLVAVINPACVPFALGAALVSLVVNVGVAPMKLSRAIWRVGGLQIGLLCCSAAVMVACDSYLGKSARDFAAELLPSANNEKSAGDSAAAVGGSPAAADNSKRTDKRTSGLFVEAGGGTVVIAPPAVDRWLAAVRPLGFTPEQPFFGTYDDDQFENWHNRYPQKAVPWLAAVLSAIALFLLITSKEFRADRAVCRIGAVLGMAWLLWFVLKYSMMFFSESLAPITFRSQLLALYVRFLLLRGELILVFLALCSSLAMVFLAMLDQLRIHPQAYAAKILIALLYLAMLIPVVVFMKPRVNKAGSVIARTEPILDQVRRDDVKLVRWIDENLPPEEGLIGLASFTGAHERPDHDEPFIYPVGGAQAVPLYAEHHNYCFNQLEPHLKNSRAKYIKHVQETFDPAWCLENNIRWFYVTDFSLQFNPGLDRAISVGQLEPVRREGNSAVYRVVEKENTDRQ